MNLGPRIEESTYSAKISESLFFLTYCCPCLNNKDTEWLYFRSNFQLFQTILSQKELVNGIWQCGILILEVLLWNVFHIKESL